MDRSDAILCQLIYEYQTYSKLGELWLMTAARFRSTVKPRFGSMTHLCTYSTFRYFLMMDRMDGSSITHDTDVYLLVRMIDELREGLEL